jgi:hypothetical protein
MLLPGPQEAVCQEYLGPYRDSILQYAQDRLSGKRKAEMARMIKVHILGRNGLETNEVSLQEAETILKEAYTDSLGGLVADRRTGKVISEIGPDVEELFIVEHMVGGG